ncbi:transposase [Microbulbifer rhizosphaerae]
MSRPLRLEFPGAWYHVMNRGAARQTIFRDSDCYTAFLDALAEAHSRFDLQIHAYCLMGNHYHLLVHTPRGNLSRGMRHINGVYTQRFNRLQRRDGPLFRGRYKAILVDADSYLLSLSRYIHRNPIETRKPLVGELEDYPWSSYPAYLNRVSLPEWLYRDFVYGALGRRNKFQAYRDYVEQGVDADIRAFYQRQRQAPIMGDDSFRARVLGEAGEISREVPRCERMLQVPESSDSLVAVVAEAFDLAVADIYARPGRGRGAWNPARALAMWLCQERAGMTLAEIGRLFGGIHYSGVSQAIRRLKGRLAEGEDGLKEIKVVMSMFSS